MTTSGSSDYAALRRVILRAAPQLKRDLPWIGHADPWAVLVSEVMLQQTQTVRVVIPWERFLSVFPTPVACADAPLSRVLSLWAGLGYHRRAKALHEATRRIRDEFGGRVPADVALLRTLPGVGDYTANAVASFAFGLPVAVLDTNVGRVLARAAANRRLTRLEARDIAQKLLPRTEVAAFNQAMIDLGSQFCRAAPLCAQCPVARVCRWRVEGGSDPAPASAAVSRPQPPFEGSDRQARGRILGAVRQGPQPLEHLATLVGDSSRTRLPTLLAALVRDGLIERQGSVVRLAET